MVGVLNGIVKLVILPEQASNLFSSLARNLGFILAENCSENFLKHKSKSHTLFHWEPKWNNYLVYGIIINE